MTAQSYNLDDLQIDIFDLHRLLVATYDIVHEMPYERDGERDHELDKLASLLRVSRDFAGRISQATDAHYHEIKGGRHRNPQGA